MIPYDKKLHFIAGLLVAVLGGVIIDPITGIGECLKGVTLMNLISTQTIKSICDIDRAW